MIETHVITVPIYRDREGWHTCRLSAKKQCPFLGFRNHGMAPVCMKGENRALRHYNRDPSAYIEPNCGMVVKSLVVEVMK